MVSSPLPRQLGPPRLVDSVRATRSFIPRNSQGTLVDVRHSLDRIYVVGSMSPMSIATPCPAPHAFSSLPVPAPNRRLSTASSQDETAEIDYTRAVQVEFKNAKPRRKSTFQRRDRKEAAITIFEDVMEDQELVVENKRELGGSTLLGRPAQRIPGRAIQRRQDVDLNANQVSHATEQARRRPSIMPAATNWTMENGPHIDLHDATHAVAEEPKMRHGLKRIRGGEPYSFQTTRHQL